MQLATIDLAEQLEGLGRVALAGLLGGALGWERGLNEKPAGLRTNMLVAMAAALVVVVGVGVVEERGDPSRGLHAVVTGIGFLGAGSIIRDQRHRSVSGLTTAATLFLSASVGVTVGHGAIVLGTATALLVLFTLYLGRLVAHLPPAWRRRIPEPSPRAIDHPEDDPTS